MKKNIVNVLLGAAVLTLFAGCNKEQVAGIETTSFNPVRASIEDYATKTTLDRSALGGKILWTKGETIKINGEVYSCLPDVDNATFASFFPDNLTAVPDENGKFVAVYPYNLKDGSGELVLDANQVYKQTSMDRVFPMYSESNDLRKFEFKNILGLLEITLKGETAISSIIVSDENLGLSGAFTVDAEGKAVLKNPASKTSVNLICNNAQLTTEGTTFYVGVPAGNYSKLKVAVISKEGIMWSVQAVKEAVIERNKIYHLEFTPALGNSVHECVQLWADGPYWATTNIGAQSPIEPGMYFSWANTTGYIWDRSTQSFVNAAVNPFTEDQYQYTHGNSFDDSEDYSGNAEFDAATAIWGEGWRTPTLAEVQRLKSIVPTKDDMGTSSDPYDDEITYVSELNGTDCIVFGKGGYFEQTKGDFTENGSGVWTSKGKSSNKVYLFLEPNNADITYKKWSGFNIRPVRDTPVQK